MRRFWQRVVLVVLLGLAPAVFGAPAAEAHSNASIVRLALTQQRGFTLVHAYLVYRGDGQPVVNEFVLATVTAGGDARSFQLLPQRSTPGHFASTVHLADGHWQLRVAAAAATKGSAVGRFTISAGRLHHVGLSATFRPARPPVDVHRRTGSGVPWRAVGAAGCLGLFGWLLLVRARVTRRSDRAATA